MASLRTFPASLFISLAVSTSAWAGSFLQTLFNRTMKLEITATYPHGAPVEGATVWILSDRPTQRFDADVMQRLISRYSADADYVFGSDVHPSLTVLYTDEKGVARYEVEEDVASRIKDGSVQVSILKRGFEPVVTSYRGEFSGNRSVHSILTKATGAPRPELIELDVLRSKAFRLAGVKMDSAARMELKNINRRIRAIGEVLENGGAKEAAAIVFYNLAFLPSTEQSVGSETVTTEVTRAFDASSPQRTADFERAVRLGPSCPQVSYRHALERFKSQGLLDMTSPASARIRPQYISEAEGFLAQYGDRMWPTTYTLLWRAYQEEGKHRLACESLRAWHRMEPTYFADTEWKHLEDMYQSWFRIQGLAPLGCDVLN